MKLFALALCIALAAATVSFDAKEGGEVVEGHYIMVFKSDISKEARDSHYAALNLVDGEEITHKYEMPGFSGYAAKLTKQSLAKVLEDETALQYAEANQMAHAFAGCETQDGLPVGLYGLSRTVQRTLPNDFTFYFNRGRGQNVDAYVIDTGVLCSHEEFNVGRGRCKPGFDEYPTEGGSDIDLNGHGTHVAGTIAGEKYGFCKDCDVFGVKVLNRQGSGSFAGVIAGINWVANVGGNKRKVANMSLGGGRSAAVNDATDACVDAGVVMVVASGNGNTNACNSSPASAEKAITVNSITRTDARSSFSNYGSCSNIFAPGSDILSAWIGSNSASSTISGTSMAAPHVAGVACEIVSEPGAPTTPAGIASRMASESSKDQVTGVPGTDTPNNLLFHACLD